VINLAKPRIFLTGGRGMVGRNILDHPLAVNYDILAPSSIELDLRDTAATHQFISQTKPDIVVHAAGRVGGIQANILNPVDFLVANTDMGRNVILAAYKAGVPFLLNLASSCIYPRNATNPLSENQILQGELEPTNEGYALAKITIARLCQYIGREHPEFKYKTLIPCNIYGRYDKFDPKYSHMVPAILHKLHQAKVNGTSHVNIWGDGRARREFMYVDDLIDCIWSSVANFDAVPDLMNVGLGHDLTVNEYYEVVANVVGYDGGFSHDLSKPVGMKQKLLSIERARSWGWQASTTLEQGVAKTYTYYLQESKNERY